MGPRSLSPRRALAVALLVACSGTAAAQPRAETLLYANCPRASGEYRAHYRGRMILAQAFTGPLGQEALPEILRLSAEQQLRYLWGHYRTDPVAHAALQVSLGAEPAQITILSRTEVPYGRDLALPYAAKEKKLEIEDAYTRRAIARGRVREADPAWLVEYEVRFPLAICGRGEDPPSTMRVPLPPDPWLAFWYVPAAQHRPMRYHHVRARTNPCADDDFAELPHPYYFWYDWLPTRRGLDDDGRAFDCRKLWRRGVDDAEVAVDLAPTGAATRDFGRLRAQLSGGLITATLVVGAVDHAVTDLGAARLREQLGEGQGELLRDRARAARAQPKLEAGTRGFLDVIDGLSTVMEVARHQSSVEDGNLLVEVNGKLRHSGRPLRVRLALGFTDFFGPVPPRHFGLLRRALRDDQLVVYWGHSGIGENFRLSQIEKHLGVSHAEMASELKRSPLRLVAFLSCYSYMYFGQDLLAAGAERDDGAYFVFTGMEQAEREAGPLAVLELVDAVLRADNPSGRLERLPRLAPDEFWLVKSVGRAR